MKSNANSLTGAILNYIRMSGGHSERVNNYSRTVKDKFGNDKYIPSMGFKGTADIHAIKQKPIIDIPGTKKIFGRFIAIEVKVGKDKQSEAQKYYQECVERAGGVYLIAHDFDEFENQWNNI
jgi:hypothetical protein